MTSFLNDLAELILKPATYFISAGQRFFWLYLLTSILVAWGVYRFHHRGERTSILGFFRETFPAKSYLHASSLLDLRYFLIDAILKTFLLAFAVILSQSVADWAGGMATAIFGGARLPLDGAAGTWVYTIGHILVFDLAYFLAHTMQHRIPFLWQFHKTHHSAQTLVPWTTYRMHPVDNILGSIISALLVGGFTGLWWEIGPGQVSEFQFMGQNLVLFLFFMTGVNLRHTSVWLPYTGWLGHIFISPAHHQIHHSVAREHWDKNQGVIFAFWDWMAGSLVVPERRNMNLTYGIDGHEEFEFNSLLKLYWLPVVKAYNLTRNWLLGGMRKST